MRFCPKLFKHMLLVRNMLNTDKKPINLYLNTGQFNSGRASTLSYIYGYVAQRRLHLTVNQAHKKHQRFESSPTQFNKLKSK